jgi:hypothetical protein
MEEALISQALEAVADRRTAQTLQKSVRPLKGVRGVPTGEIARIAAAAWKDQPVVIDDDREGLSRLFHAAYEDGLIAIGLLAAALPDDPDAALDLGLEWLKTVDDLFTADALGWLVLGPAILATQSPPSELIEPAKALDHHAPRRAAVSAGLAWTPQRLEGPAAAPLRARVGERHLRFVEETHSTFVDALACAFVRDEAPSVRKAMRRLLRAWTSGDPAAVVQWADGVRGGLPKLFKEEVDRARRHAARLSTEGPDEADEAADPETDEA